MSSIESTANQCLCRAYGDVSKVLPSLVSYESYSCYCADASAYVSVGAAFMCSCIRELLAKKCDTAWTDYAVLSKNGAFSKLLADSLKEDKEENKNGTPCPSMSCVDIFAVSKAEKKADSDVSSSSDS